MYYLYHKLLCTLIDHRSYKIYCMLGWNALSLSLSLSLSLIKPKPKHVDITNVRSIRFSTRDTAYTDITNIRSINPI